MPVFSTICIKHFQFLDHTIKVNSVLVKILPKMPLFLVHSRFQSLVIAFYTTSKTHKIAPTNDSVSIRSIRLALSLFDILTLILRAAIHILISVFYITTLIWEYSLSLVVSEFPNIIDHTRNIFLLFYFFLETLRRLWHEIKAHCYNQLDISNVFLLLISNLVLFVNFWVINVFKVFLSQLIWHSTLVE